MELMLRRREMMKMQSGGGHYIRCEYIESSGDAYLDTELYPQDYDEVILDMIVTTKGTWDGFFGTQKQYSTIDNTKRLGFLNNTSRLGYVIGGNQHNIDYNLTAGTRYTIDCICSNTSRALLINNQSVFTASTTYTFNSAVSTWLFASNYAGQVKSGEIAYAKMYDVVFKKESQTVAHFIPAYIGNDIGMYDEIRGIFKTSIGSAPFTKGGDV